MTEMFFQLHAMPSTRVTFAYNKEGARKAKRFVNFYNGKCDLYRTVYNFREEVSASNALIDKIFLDFDTEYALEDIRVLSKYLMKENIKHSIYFSGRGFHLYLYTEPRLASDYNNVKIAMRNYVKELVDKLKIKPDWNVIGDCRRVSRLINTVNMKSSLFAIPLKNINLSYKKIIALAQKPIGTTSVIRGELLDLTLWDIFPKTIEYRNESYDVFLGEDISDKVPLCVKELLKSGCANYRERFFIITALKELGYSMSDVENIIWKYLVKVKPNGQTFAEHCIEEENQVEKIFDADPFFPSCHVIQRENYCIKGCPGQKIYI